MGTMEKKLTSIRIDKSLYNHLQKRAKRENRSLNNYIETLLFEASEYYEPNEKTIAAMNEVMENREGLTRISSKEELKDFFEKLKRGEE